MELVVRRRGVALCCALLWTGTLAVPLAMAQGSGAGGAADSALDGVERPLEDGPAGRPSEPDPPPDPALRKVPEVLRGELAPHAEEGVVELSAKELNTYVASLLDSGGVPGITGAEIVLGRGHLRATIHADTGALLVRYIDPVPEFLAGKATRIVLEEGLGTSSGRLQLTFRSASVGVLPLPQTLVETVVTAALGAQETVALDQSVPLWPGVREIRAEPGRVVFELDGPVDP